jgi:vacuolar-type H+-ATPase subunit H
MPKAQDIDLIRKAEETAEERIRAAEDSAREIRKQTESSIKKIMKNSDAKGKKAAKARLDENEAKRAARERKFQKKVDKIIAQVQEVSKDRKPVAVRAVVEMILGGVRI